MINKNLVVKIENLIMNHKSWPNKSNLDFSFVWLNQFLDES